MECDTAGLGSQFCWGEAGALTASQGASHLPFYGIKHWEADLLWKHPEKASQALPNTKEESKNLLGNEMSQHESAGQVLWCPRDMGGGRGRGESHYFRKHLGLQRPMEWLKPLASQGSQHRQVLTSEGAGRDLNLGTVF